MNEHEECMKYNLLGPLNVLPTNYTERNMNFKVKDLMKLIFSSLYSIKKNTFLKKTTIFFLSSSG